MRISRWKKLALATSAAFILSGASGFAQSGSTDESKRKVKTKTLPLYPDLAKRMNVTGKVKIEVVITPEGRVKSSRVVGGTPLARPGLPGRREGMEVCACARRDHPSC